MPYYLCEDFNDQYPKCTDFKKEENFIDLRGINNQSYTPGETIIGDLETLGWVVVRGARIDTPNNEVITEISKKSHSFYGSWHSIIANSSNYRMKYNHTSTVRKEWSGDLLKKIREEGKKKSWIRYSLIKNIKLVNSVY